MAVSNIKACFECDKCYKQQQSGKRVNMEHKDVELLFSELSKLPQVEAVALGGSRAGDNYDEKSDYDIYLYCTQQIPEKTREKILSEYCSYMEIGNHYWESEDNCVLNNGIDIDILHRNLDDFAKGIDDVVTRHQASNGYTTCMWHNLVSSKIIFDKDGRLSKLQAQYTIPYPQELKQNIINRNMKLLRGSMPAYEGQISKAVRRSDLVSINHRITEFIASYFDIIFALNELTHPGEKRLIEICERDCKILPPNFRKNLNRLFTDMFTHSERIEKDIDAIINEIENIIVKYSKIIECKKKI